MLKPQQKKKKKKKMLFWNFPRMFVNKVKYHDVRMPSQDKDNLTCPPEVVMNRRLSEQSSNPFQEAIFDMSQS